MCSKKKTKQKIREFKAHFKNQHIISYFMNEQASLARRREKKPTQNLHIIKKK